MKSAKAIRDVAERCWRDGRPHSAHVLGNPLATIEIPLNPPAGRQLVSEFAKAQAWATEITALARRHDLKIEHRLVDNRNVGRQKLPERLVIDSCDALSLTGTRREFDSFVALCSQVLERAPALRELFATQSHWVMSYHDQWTAILQMLDFVAGHDVSGLYLREVDLPGIDTKFIGAHRGILDAVMRAALPAHKLRDCESSLSGQAFERRYGFNYEQPLVRFRFLDPSREELYDDLSVPLDQFASTPIAVSTVFIVENKMNLLAFPSIANALALWGQGYAVTRLSKVPWLEQCRLIYFGDIDTHGFTILDRLRKKFPQVQSMLMDRSTLKAHQHAWVKEPKSKRQLNALVRLNDEEQALFDDLRQDRFGHAIRLEQERIGYRTIESAARKMAGDSGG